MVLPWELLRLTLPCASLQAPAADQQVFLVPFGLWTDPCTASYGGSCYPGEKHEGRATAVSGANSWSTVCLHAAGSRTSSRSRSLQRHPRGGGNPRKTPKKLQISRIFLTFEGPRKKTKCSQINYSNYLGTSQKVGLALLKAQDGIASN